jgi:RNA-directed DNA polymerase
VRRGCTGDGGLALRSRPAGGEAPNHPHAALVQDGKRRASYEHTEFTYLGFTFRQRRARAKDGRQLNSFLPAISKDVLKKISAEV